MEELAPLLVALAIKAVFGALCAGIASNRGRSPVAWFFIGLLFDCFAIVVLLVLPDPRKEQERHRALVRENQRLRERVRLDRQVADHRQDTSERRLGAHDRALGLDTADVEAEEPPEGLPPPVPEPDREWFYAADGQRHGPFGWTRLQELWRDGTLDGSTLVWTAGMDDWRAAVDVPDLVERLDA